MTQDGDTSNFHEMASSVGARYGGKIGGCRGLKLVVYKI